MKHRRSGSSGGSSGSGLTASERYRLRSLSISSDGLPSAWRAPPPVRTTDGCHVLTLVLKNAHVGTLMGKGGARMRTLRETSTAYIHVAPHVSRGPNASERSITVVGSAEQVSRVHALLAPTIEGWSFEYHLEKSPEGIYSYVRRLRAAAECGEAVPPPATDAELPPLGATADAPKPAAGVGQGGSSQGDARLGTGRRVVTDGRRRLLVGRRGRVARTTRAELPREQR